jgi:hypothetical protein
MSHRQYDPLIYHSEYSIRQISRSGQYHRFICFRYIESSFRLSQKASLVVDGSHRRVYETFNSFDFADASNDS